MPALLSRAPAAVMTRTAVRSQHPRGQGSRPAPRRPATVARASPSYTPTPADVATPSTTNAPPIDDFASDARPVMLYDGVCGLCNVGVDAALALDGRRRRLRFAALQSPAGRRLLARAGRAPDDISSVVLVMPDGRAFIESAAVVEIGRVLGVPGPVAAAALALPARGRDAAYRAVADNRYTIFGRRDACRVTQGGAGNDPADPGRFLVE